VKSPARVLCLLAWTLAFIAQVMVVYRAPDSFVVFGVEMAHANKMVGIHALIVVSFGLALAIAAFFAKRWGPYLAAFSAVLYWVRWFPLKSVLKVGPVPVAKGMFLIASNPNAGWSVALSNFVLPPVFIIVIVLATFELRRPTSTAAVLGSQ
jgi:hypothetical protein